MNEAQRMSGINKKKIIANKPSVLRPERKRFLVENSLADRSNLLL